MTDIVLEIIRALILLYIVFYMLKAERKRRELCRKGWNLTVAGFSLLLFGAMMDITDNFESLNRFVIIGDTPAQAFMEKMVGFMGGFALVAIGLIRWIPTVTGVEYDKQINKELEKEIAERKQAEESLRYANDIIVKSPVVAFLWKNAEGWPVEYASENVKQIFGWTREDFVSGAIAYSSIVHPEDMPRVAKEVSQASSDVNSKMVTHAPYRIITRDDQVRWVEDVTTIRRAEDGSIVAYEGILLDITDRKQTEQDLKNSVDEIERFNKLMMGREDRVIEMKRQVNALLAELGKEPQYPSVLEDEEAVISSE
jgi:PAS domain S-box-containing protein